MVDGTGVMAVRLGTHVWGAGWRSNMEAVPCGVGLAVVQGSRFMIS